MHAHARLLQSTAPDMCKRWNGPVCHTSCNTLDYQLQTRSTAYADTCACTIQHRLMASNTQPWLTRAILAPQALACGVVNDNTRTIAHTFCHMSHFCSTPLSAHSLHNLDAQPAPTLYVLPTKCGGLSRIHTAPPQCKRCMRTRTQPGWQHHAYKRLCTTSA